MHLDKLFGNCLIPVCPGSFLMWLESATSFSSVKFVHIYVNDVQSTNSVDKQIPACLWMQFIQLFRILGFKRPVFTFIMLSSYGNEYMAINKDHWFPCIKNQNVHCVCLMVFQIDIMTIFFFWKRERRSD